MTTTEILIACAVPIAFGVWFARPRRKKRDEKCSAVDQYEISNIEALRARLDAGRESELANPVTSETFEELRRRAGNADRD